MGLRSRALGFKVVGLGANLDLGFRVLEPLKTKKVEHQATLAE